MIYRVVVNLDSVTAHVEASDPKAAEDRAKLRVAHMLWDELDRGFGPNHLPFPWMKAADARPSTQTKEWPPW